MLPNQEVFENVPPLLRVQRAIATSARYLAIKCRRRSLNLDHHVRCVAIRQTELADGGFWHVDPDLDPRETAALLLPACG